MNLISCDNCGTVLDKKGDFKMNQEKRTVLIHAMLDLRAAARVLDLDAEQLRSLSEAAHDTLDELAEAFPEEHAEAIENAGNW